MNSLNLNNLNSEQLEAVKLTDGAILVSAGAGTGKTRVLTYRVAYLINQCNVSPSNILAITFTNKATNEMKERITTLCKNGNMVNISTFHSLCSRILRGDIFRLGGWDRYFTILDDSDRNKVIKKIVKNFNPDAESDFEKKLGYYISKAKNENIKPDNFLSVFPYITYAKDYANLYGIYEETLKKTNSLDFDDLLIKTMDLFKAAPEVLNFYQNKFKYILVDEFQDTNSVQYDLIKMLSAIHKNVLVVGDEDQSIYGFRGANYQNLNKFKNDFSNVKVIKLEQNYRSTKQILDRANLLINKNIERSESKKLFTTFEGGDEVVYNILDNDYKEADFVALEIQRLFRRGVSASEIAVIYRINSLSRQIENCLVNNGIGYRIYGGFKFYERAEIKNLLSYLRLLVNPRDNEAFLRVCNFPKRGIGDATIKRLAAIADEDNTSLLNAALAGKLKHTGISLFNMFFNELKQSTENLILPEIVSKLISNLKINEIYNKHDEEDATRILNIKGLQSAVNEFYENNTNATLTDFLENVNLDAIKNKEEDTDVVTLSTIHGVKGLEFDVVFIIGCEEGMLPFKRSIDDGEIEEERRLCYVAITRAKRKLYLTRARERYGFSYGGGYNVGLTKSRFLTEMEFSSVEEEQQNHFAFNYSESNNYNQYGNNYGSNYNKQYKSSYSANYYGNNYNSVKQQKSSLQKSSFDILENLIGLKRASEIVKEQGGTSKKLPVGTRVSHVRFGEGVVTSVDSNKPENAVITFDSGTVKELNLNFAPLEILE